MTIQKYSIAKENHFSVVFNRIPEITQLIKSLPLPSVSMGNTIAPYRGMNIPVGGSAPKFGSITITIRIDEDHEIVEKILQWMFSNQVNNEIGGGGRTVDSLKEDLTVIINNNTGNPVRTYSYIGCVPTDFSMNEFKRGSSEDLEATLVLEFDYYKTEKDGN